MAGFPSIVPNHDGTLYFVLKDLGRYGTAFIETDPVENNRESIIDDRFWELAEVLQVLAIDVGAGTARDVTREIMAEAEGLGTAHA